MPNTSKGFPYVEGPDALADYPSVSLTLANLLDAMPGVRAMTTTARDTLAGSDLWVGRTIFNLTTARLESWNGSAWTITGTGSFLPLTGGTLTGHVSRAADPTENDHLARKSYVDTAVSGGVSGADYLPLSGGTLTGILTLNNDLLLTMYRERRAATTSTSVSLNFKGTQLVDASTTQSVTVSFSNIPSSSAEVRSLTFVTRATAIVWPAGTLFAAGEPPFIDGQTWLSLVATNGVVTVFVAATDMKVS
ncbi:MAG: hypothetical protein ABR616_05940 [Dermatophilaceae bacterium]|nr:hypothetical protein [Intrasporangiaceae bacterium]